MRHLSSHYRPRFGLQGWLDHLAFDVRLDELVDLFVVVPDLDAVAARRLHSAARVSEIAATRHVPLPSAAGWATKQVALNVVVPNLHALAAAHIHVVLTGPIPLCIDQMH